MADGAVDLLNEARTEAYATPLDQIDLSVPERFRDNTMWPFFERIRKEDPVHYTAESKYGKGTAIILRLPLGIEDAPKSNGTLSGMQLGAVESRASVTPQVEA